MKNEIIKAEDYGLTKKQGLEISNKFKVIEEEKKVIVSEYNEIIKQELSAKLSIEASILDKKMQKHLKAKKDIHTANKSFFLSGGRFVDSIYNIEKVEFDIMRGATKKIKDYAENLEKERIEKLNNKRINLVKPYLEEVDNLNLAYMEDDVFEAYLLTKKNNYEAIVKADKEREEARLKAIAEEKAEQERIRVENAKLKEEAEAKEKALEIERKEFRAKQDAIELKAKQEREELEAKLKAKQDAELKAKQIEEAHLQSELNKGDAEKVKDLINDFELLKSKYTFKSAKNKKMYLATNLLIDKVINFISK